MNRKKQRTSRLNLPTKLFLVVVSILSVAFGMLPQSVSAHHASDCSDVFTPLSTSVTNGVNSNRWFYEQVMNQTGVPWEMLAAIHYRETNFSHTNPSNGQGIFQFVGGEGGPYPAGPVSDTEFLRQLRFMADKLQNDYVWRGSIPRERRRLQPNETNTSLVKDTLFSYNGRATVYANQAAHFGFRSDIQPFEGSPYVMNRFDCARARMGMITQDFGSMDGVDTRYGTFTIFARLRGDAYWRSLWNDYGFGEVVAVIAADNGGPQYVVNSGKKYLIPDVPTKIAWNLHVLSTIVLPASQVNAIPPGPILPRAVHSGITGQGYLIDNGKRYPSDDRMLENWGVQDAPFLPGPLVNYVTDGSSFLTQFIQHPSDGRVFLMDGGHLKYVPTPAALMAWGGEAPVVISPSSALFNLFTEDAATADGFKIQYGGRKYIVNGPYIVDLPASLDAAFPGPTVNVNAQTIRRLTPAGTATPLIHRGGNGTVYLANGGLRYYMPTLQMLYGWAPAHQVSIMTLNAGHMSYFTDAGTLNTFMARNPSTNQYYIIDGSKQPIDASLVPQYTTNQPVLDYLGIDIMPTGQPVKPLMQPTDSGAVYLLDSGKRYHITSLANYVLWGGGQQGHSSLAPYVAAMFADDGSIERKITVSGTSYWLGNVNTVYGMNSRAVTHWPSQSSVTLQPATLNRLTNGGSLPVDFRVDSNYCVMRRQQLFCTTSRDRAAIWKLTNATSINGLAVNGMLPQPIPNFVYSPDDSSVGISFITDSKLLHVSTPIQVFNLGYRGEIMVGVDATDIAAHPATSWNGVIVRNPNDLYFTFDQGFKRHLDGNAVRMWTNNFTVDVPLVSHETLDIFPSNYMSITRSIQASGDSRVFTVNGLERQWVRSFDNYVQNYAPHVMVSGLLRDSLSEGSPL
jgi:hypothetical protein